MTNQAMTELKEKLDNYKASDRNQYSHIWSDTDGSRCEKCGDKDWMADVLCSVSDNEHEINKGLKS